MNVYVHSLATALARAGVPCDVITRAEHSDQPPAVTVEPGFRVLHVAGGPRRPMRKEELSAFVDEFVDAVHRRFRREGSAYDVIHANYWISGQVGHRLKHDLGLPLVTTFHTLASVKADAGISEEPAERARIESEVIRCADHVVVSTEDEAAHVVDRYAADPTRVEVVSPGVDRSIFSPGDRARARGALRLDGRPVLLFVGRLQPLKGADLAVRCLAELRDERACLLVVGGPSGPDGQAEVSRLEAMVSDLHLEGRVRFVDPVPHDRLATYYRAADVCLVPSRIESFGLVALEAAACGLPVVAADVSGLRAQIHHGISGFLVATRDPKAYAERVDELLADPLLRDTMASNAAARAVRFTWSIAAARLRRLYADLAARALVECS